MSKARLYTAIDFTGIKPEQVRHMVKDLYGVHPNEKREPCPGQGEDRRRSDRRHGHRAVLLDTRTSQSRRQSAGRRRHDENLDNKHKVGVDYYA